MWLYYWNAEQKYTLYSLMPYSLTMNTHTSPLPLLLPFGLFCASQAISLWQQVSPSMLNSAGTEFVVGKEIKVTAPAVERLSRVLFLELPVCERLWEVLVKLTVSQFSFNSRWQRERN